MKTVSTKLSKEDFEKFQEVCNNDGQCLSEGLRDLIKMSIETSEDEPITEKIPIIEGKIIRIEPSELRNVTISD